MQMRVLVDGHVFSTMKRDDVTPAELSKITYDGMKPGMVFGPMRFQLDSGNYVVLPPDVAARAIIIFEVD